MHAARRKQDVVAGTLDLLGGLSAPPPIILYARNSSGTAPGHSQLSFRPPRGTACVPPAIPFSLFSLSVVLSVSLFRRWFFLFFLIGLVVLLRCVLPLSLVSATACSTALTPDPTHPLPRCAPQQQPSGLSSRSSPLRRSSKDLLRCRLKMQATWASVRRW